MTIDSFYDEQFESGDDPRLRPFLIASYQDCIIGIYRNPYFPDRSRTMRRHNFPSAVLWEQYKVINTKHARGLFCGVHDVTWQESFTGKKTHAETPIT